MENIKKKSQHLWIMCGPVASGKSTWIANKISEIGGIHISRDKIRFSKISSKGDYFSKENEVFNEFISLIQKEIDSGTKNIFIDATHITPISRNKLLNKLYFNSNVGINMVNMYCDKNICLKRNSQRTGLAKVPNDVVERMCATFVPATNGEKYIYDNIYNIYST